jgi:hypothetical protein
MYSLIDYSPNGPNLAEKKFCGRLIFACGGFSAGGIYNRRIFGHSVGNHWYFSATAAKFGG